MLTVVTFIAATIQTRRLSVFNQVNTVSQGCNFGYTAPQFISIAKTIQSSSVLPSILDDALHLECMHMQSYSRTL